MVAAVGDAGTPGADGDATGAVKPTRLTAEARSYQQLLQRRWYARGLAPEMGAPGDGGGGHGKCGCGDADVVRVEERSCETNTSGRCEVRQERWDAKVDPPCTPAPPRCKTP